MAERWSSLAREMVGEVRKEWRHLRLAPSDSMGFLTYRCTSRCSTCNIWQQGDGSPGRELEVEQWLRVIERLARAGVKSFEVFGGDALLRKDVIFEVVRRATNLGLRTYFPTNGNLCDAVTARGLVEAGLGTIYFSIDDVGEEHDAIRGVEGTFLRVEESLSHLVEARGGGRYPQIVICTTLSKTNFSKFSRLLEYLSRYPIDAVYPRAVGEFSNENVEASAVGGLKPEPYFASADGESHLLSVGEYEEFRVMVARLKREPGPLYVNWRAVDVVGSQAFTRGEYPIRRCHIATGFVTVTPQGEVTPCPFFRAYAIGNLVEEPLEEIWGNRRHREFVRRQQAGDLPLCRNCNMRVYYPSMLETLTYYGRRAVEMAKAKAVST